MDGARFANAVLAWVALLQKLPGGLVDVLSWSNQNGAMAAEAGFPISP